MYTSLMEKPLPQEVSYTVQALFTIFLVQTLDGCGDPICTKPACYAFRKNNSVAPLRPFTRWTARSIALFLASSNNAESQLCQRFHYNVDVLRAARQRRGGEGVNETDPRSFMQQLVNTRSIKSLDGYDIFAPIGRLVTCPLKIVPFDLNDEESLSKLKTGDMRALFMAAWNGHINLVHDSTAGSMLRHMNRLLHKNANLSNEFLPMLSLQHTDVLRVAESWIYRQTHELSILDFPWLFTTDVQIQHFRALCFFRLSSASTDAKIYSRLIEGQVYWIQDPDEFKAPMRMELNGLAARHFYLSVSRDNMLADTFDQLWRREPQEFWKPIKVKINNEGEEGQDLGGVSTEFFKVVIQDIFDPKYGGYTSLCKKIDANARAGLFKTDEQSGMAWFDPSSTAELYKYELAGLLVALAAYNGHHIAVNFPSVLYHKLLHRPLFEEHALSFLEDGWPDLHGSLANLLSYDGNVEHDFSASYAFSFQSFGQHVEIDMTTIQREDAGSMQYIIEHQDFGNAIPAIVNENREQFVKDYVFWLTDKAIRRQYGAFAKGFYTCFGQDVLKTIGPAGLRTVVEGLPDINIKKLKDITTYVDYDRNDQAVRDFWHIVEHLDSPQQTQLLEFVTGTSRIPVNGIERMSFKIIRNGRAEVKSRPTSPL